MYGVHSDVLSPYGVNYNYVKEVSCALMTKTMRLLDRFDCSDINPGLVISVNPCAVLTQILSLAIPLGVHTLQL